MQEAAVCWVERDGKVLVVWNRRYRGWTLPGGLVEEGETPLQAMARELREETSLFAESAPVIHYAPAELLADGPKNRGSHVWVFRCDQTIGAASEQEPGCPVMWITRDEFLALCPFKRFYERMFTKLGWDYADEVSVSQDDQVVKRALLDAAGAVLDEAEIEVNVAEATISWPDPAVVPYGPRSIHPDRLIDLARAVKAGRMLWDRPS